MWSNGGCFCRNSMVPWMFCRTAVLPASAKASALLMEPPAFLLWGWNGRPALAARSVWSVLRGAVWKDRIGRKSTWAGSARQKRKNRPGGRFFHGNRGLQAVLGLVLATATVQHRLGVTVGLLGAFEDQLQRRLEGDVVVEVRRHRAVGGVAGVLAVHHHGHALHALDDLLLADHAVAQP